MNTLYRAAIEIEDFCHQRSWDCCVIGGLAVQRWGEPRMTRDVDLTIVTGLGHEVEFIDALLGHYTPRIAEARQFALDHRVVLVYSGEVPLDISLAGLPYESRLLSRASRFAVAADAGFMTCSAEDLVVLKVFAGRPLDWVDVESIVVRQGGRLNRQLILDELLPLLELKEDPEAIGQLQKTFAKHQPTGS